MTHEEFQKEYRYSKRMWPDVCMINSGDMSEKIATVETTYYDKVGSRWKQTDGYTEDVSREWYMNCIEAVPFFRNMGGSERITKSYTPYGLIPVRISSCSPNRMRKVVREFRFF